MQYKVGELRAGSLIFSRNKNYLYDIKFGPGTSMDVLICEKYCCA